MNFEEKNIRVMHKSDDTSDHPGIFAVSVCLCTTEF